MNNNGFAISSDKKSLTLNGVEFYTPNMSGCRDGVNCALLMEKGVSMVTSEVQAMHNQLPEVVVGTGNCCHGYLVLIHEGRVVEMQSLDFNVCGIQPVIHTVKGRDGKDYDGAVGLLAWGAGCDGDGIRFISGFTSGLPEVVDIVPSSEGCKAHHSWFSLPSVLDYPNLWKRMEEAGVKVDIDATKKLCASSTLLKRQ